jgi:hypothetical protein
MAAASLRELGATAPIVLGWRINVERKCQASPAKEGRLGLAAGAKPPVPVVVSVIE